MLWVNGSEKDGQCGVSMSEAAALAQSLAVPLQHLPPASQQGFGNVPRAHQPRVTPDNSGCFWYPALQLPPSYLSASCAGISFDGRSLSTWPAFLLLELPEKTAIWNGDPADAGTKCSP